jgi:hypothetical protein
LSPIALYTMNMTRILTPPDGLGVLAAAYGALGVVSYIWLRRVLRRETAIVRGKLARMGLAS